MAWGAGQLPVASWQHVELWSSYRSGLHCKWKGLIAGHQPDLGTTWLPHRTVGISKASLKGRIYFYFLLTSKDVENERIIHFFLLITYFKNGTWPRKLQEAAAAIPDWIPVILRPLHLFTFIFLIVFAHFKLEASERQKRKSSPFY